MEVILLTIGSTVILSISGYLLKREVDRHDRDITQLNQKSHQLEINQTQLNGKLDTTIAILERLDKQLENLLD